MTDPNPIAFAKAILTDYPDLGNLDGGDIQELAEKHGLLVAETRRSFCDDGNPDKCCDCHEYHGDLLPGETFQCFHIHPLLCGKESQ